MIHPDDEVFYSGTWADQFATYSDACRYYGCDTPEQIAAEEEYEAALWAKEKAELEAAFGPYADSYGLGLERVYFAKVPLSQQGTVKPEDDYIPF